MPCQFSLSRKGTNGFALASLKPIFTIHITSTFRKAPIILHLGVYDVFQRRTCLRMTGASLITPHKDTSYYIWRGTQTRRKVRLCTRRVLSKKHSSEEMIILTDSFIHCAILVIGENFVLSKLVFRMRSFYMCSGKRNRDRHVWCLATSSAIGPDDHQFYESTCNFIEAAS